MTALSLLKQAKEALIDSECGHRSFCTGHRKPRNMMTCARCAMIWKINQYLKGCKHENKVG